jgi:hypothetical protein
VTAVFLLRIYGGLIVFQEQKLRLFFALLISALVTVFTFQSATAASCTAAKLALSRRIHALYAEIHELYRQSGGADTPEVCHLTKQQEDAHLQYKSLIANSQNHCGVTDSQFQQIQSVSYDSARASCGVNWK